MQNPFFRENSSYTRHMNLVKDAIADLALGLYLRLIGEGATADYDKCYQFVKDYVAFDNPNSPTFDRKIDILNRRNFEDRVEQTTTFTKFINSVVTNEYIMAPTFTAYNNKKQHRSLVGKMLEANVEKRALTKKEKSVAQANNDKIRESFLDNLQTAYKLSNNSSSGAKLSAGTPLFLASGHPSLTSTCRKATSFANAMNERFIAGNRHYHSAEVTINNVINSVRITDLVVLQEAIDYYQLHLVTPEEAFECIMDSARNYWNDSRKEKEIMTLLRGMTPVERCAVTYVSDLHYLAKYNPDVVRVMFDRMSYVATNPINDGVNYIGLLDSDQVATVSLMCVKFSAGKHITAMVKNNDPSVGYIQATAKNFLDTLHEYDLLISALWMTRFMPASTARLPNIIRKVAVVSDTDSTIFTVQSWTKWYTGSYNFSDQSKNVAWVVIYLSSQLISHVLAMMSANMGIGVEDIKEIAMKNEYAFPVLGLCQRAKHYFAYMSAQEGLVFGRDPKKPQYAGTFKVEQKGVALRNANAPPRIAKRFKHFLYYVLDGIMAQQKLDYFSIVKQLVEVETSIISGIMKGSSEFLTGAQVKHKVSYKVGEKASQWRQHLLWQAVFAPTYGEADEPPYMAVKLSLDLRNKQAIVDWLERTPTKGIRDRMTAYVEENNITDMKFIYVPKEIARTEGIPPDILEAADYRKLVFTIMEPFYLVLETLGIFINKLKPNEKQVKRLITDYYTMEDLIDYEIEHYEKNAADVY